MAFNLPANLNPQTFNFLPHYSFSIFLPHYILHITSSFYSRISSSFILLPHSYFFLIHITSSFIFLPHSYFFLIHISSSFIFLPHSILRPIPLRGVSLPQRATPNSFQPSHHGSIGPPPKMAYRLQFHLRVALVCCAFQHALFGRAPRPAVAF